MTERGGRRRKKDNYAIYLASRAIKRELAAGPTCDGSGRGISPEKREGKEKLV